MKIAYSLDGITRKTVTRTIATGSIVTALLVSAAATHYGIFPALSEYLIDQFEYDGIVLLAKKLLGIFGADVLSFTLFFYFGAHYVFDKWLWRTRFFSGRINTPDLSGDWIGTLTRTLLGEQGAEEDVPIRVTIGQDFTLMSFSLHNPVASTATGITTSHSKLSGITGSQNAGYMLREGYSYLDSDGKEIFGMTNWSIKEDKDGAFMSGEYTSSIPCKGEMRVCRVLSDQHCLCGKVMEEQLDGGRSYLKLHIPRDIGKRYLKRLATKFTRPDVLDWSKNRIKRDGDEFHLTVVSPPEYAKLSDAQKANFQSDEVSFVLMHLSELSEKGNRAFFVTVLSPHIDYLRKQAGLPKRDLHVTLGFDPEDIYRTDRGNGNRLETQNWRGKKRIYRR